MESGIFSISAKSHSIVPQDEWWCGEEQSKAGCENEFVAVSRFFFYSIDQGYRKPIFSQKRSAQRRVLSKTRLKFLLAGSNEWLTDYNLLRKPETFVDGVIVKNVRSNICKVLFSLQELPAGEVWLTERNTPIQRTSANEVKIGGQ